MTGQGLFALGNYSQPKQGLFALFPGTQTPGTGETSGGGGSYDPSYNQAAKTTLNAASNLQGPDYSNLQSVNPSGYDAARQAATQNAQNYFNTQLNKQYARSDEDFRQQMADQGLDSGSEAYKRNYDLYNTAKNNAYNQAAYNAYNAGQAEQQQTYNQALGLRGQQFNEANQAANYGLNQANSLLGNLQGFVGQQNQANLQQGSQTFQGGQNALERAQQLAMQGNQLAFQGGQNALERAQQLAMQGNQFGFQGGQNALERAQQLAMQGNQFGFQGAQNEAQRQFLGGQSELERQFQGGIDWSKLNPLGQQGAQRQTQEDIGLANMNLIRAILGQLGIGTGGPGGGQAPLAPVPGTGGTGGGTGGIKNPNYGGLT